MISPLRWNRASYYLLSALLFTIFLIIYIWWPLASAYLSYIDWQGPWWLYIDWLLIGIFFVMSTLIMIGADLRRDILIVFVGILGGLAIESWGTQTKLWVYYTLERPPLWIIPAWPIASLSIDRLVRLLDRLLPLQQIKNLKNIYYFLMACFLMIMVMFVFPTIAQSLTVLSTALVVLAISTTRDFRLSMLNFLAGSGLGYFLELWGTTRECWTYYTHQTPPLFAVFAHGMAALIFWRASHFLQLHLSVQNLSDLWQRFFNRRAIR